MIEEIIRDFITAKNATANTNTSSTTTAEYWSCMILRYFNPVGAHCSGHIGEDPNGPPNNLMPYVSQVAVGRRESLTVFGSDYDTPDGTGVRDYIHVMDLAEGHLAALEYLQKIQNIQCNGNNNGNNDGSNGSNEYRGLSDVVNLGSGIGISVLEMIAAMKKASGRDIPYTIGARRSGDIDTCYADPKKAKELFNWSTTRCIDDVCTDLWKWQSNNPNGYNTTSTTGGGVQK